MLAVYTLLLTASPLLHHDSACHLKSPTHCTSCTANPWASRVEAGAPLGAQPLLEAGRVVEEKPAIIRGAERFAPGGRSPPA